jgi:peptidoglycan hydrolase CwlO-like protein
MVSCRNLYELTADPASVRKSLASSQLRTTTLERRVLDLEQQIADKDRIAEDLRSESARLENERHQLYEAQTREKNESDAKARAWATEKVS